MVYLQRMDQVMDTSHFMLDKPVHYRDNGGLSLGDTVDLCQMLFDVIDCIDCVFRLGIIN